MRSYLYVAPGLSSVGFFDNAELEEFTERHSFRAPVLPLTPVSSIEQTIAAPRIDGVVFALTSGLPNRHLMRLLRYALRCRRAVYLNWPMESAVEVVDAERYRSLWRHKIAFSLATRVPPLMARWRRGRASSNAADSAPAAPTPDSRAVLEPIAASAKFLASDYDSTKAHVLGGIGALPNVARALGELAAAAADVEIAAEEIPEAVRAKIADVRAGIDGVRAVVDGLVKHMDGGEIALQRLGHLIDDLNDRIAAGMAPAGLTVIGNSGTVDTLIADYRRTLANFGRAVNPVPFPSGTPLPTATTKIPGTGVYVRADYWSQLVSGGSYGHTCYVAQELAATSDDFVCLMASHFQLLDDLGLRQEVLRPQIATQNEVDLLAVDSFFYDALRARLETIRPAYLYERLVMGNFAVARLSRDLGIPYILEYNGSEIAMRHSFGSGSFDNEALFIEAELLAFRQATAISVISEHVRQDVASRGIDPSKIFVNPNGVNCDEYCPGSAAERSEIRASLGLPDGARVIGFIGTFGGWHGIDILAAAMPEICRRDPNLRFLLIGDGNLKHLVHDAIGKHGLHNQIVDVGRTEQRVGARLLKAADIYISPHSSHMRDSPFFGSPTKLFEYMAMGGGIVASDLEQLGEVLTPALRPADFARGNLAVGAERAVLCRPGDVDEFVEGVMALVNHAEVAAALGRNARAAALEHFSWRSHVARTWRHALGLGVDDSWRVAKA